MKNENTSSIIDKREHTIRSKSEKGNRGSREKEG